MNIKKIELQTTFHAFKLTFIVLKLRVIFEMRKIFLWKIYIRESVCNNTT